MTERDAGGNELPWDRPKPHPDDGDLFAQGGRFRYTYIGDRMTARELTGKYCEPVRRPDGRCIVGRGSALVTFEGETEPRVVIRRRLRLNR